MGASKSPGNAAITIQVAPAYDLLRSLWLLAQPAAMPRWRAWAEATAEAIAPGDLRLARRWFRAKGSSVLGLACDALVPLLPAPGDGAHLLSALASLPLPDFLRLMITASAIDPDAPLEAADLLALHEQPDLAREFLGRYLRVSGHERTHLLAIFAAPEEARAELLGLIRRHAERAFLTLEARLRDERQAAADRWRETDLRHERLRAILNRYDLAGFSPVVIAPSVLLDAQVGSYFQEIRRSLLDGSAYEPFILLVGTQRDLVPTLPPVSTLPPDTGRRQRMARAASKQTASHLEQQVAEEAASAFEYLADGSRLRIVHLLAQRPHYGQELAAALGMSAATISHHMTLLMRAGLVTIERQSHRTYYVLRTRLLVERLEAGLRYALSAPSALLSTAQAEPPHQPEHEGRPS